MANMSYCRLQNTLGDLYDCELALNDSEPDELSDEEQKARRRLIELCIKIAKNFGPDKVSNALFAIPLKDMQVPLYRE